MAAGYRAALKKKAKKREENRQVRIIDQACGKNDTIRVHAVASNCSVLLGKSYSSKLRDVQN